MTAPAFDAAAWSALKTDRDGLIPAVIQHADRGQVLMVGYMNREAVEATLTSGKVTFWSRSRQRLWEKGEQSGNHLLVKGIHVDCDRDCLLVLAESMGPTCHTGKASCFFQGLTAGDADVDPPTFARGADSFLQQLLAVIESRKAGHGTTSASGRSYVRELLAKGPEAVGAKITEEADELRRALTNETPMRVVAEAADLVFHTLVGLAARDIGLEPVIAELAKRSGISGIDEKLARGQGKDGQPSSP